MKKELYWLISIVVGLIIIGFLVVGRSDRQAYRAARGAVNTRVEATQDRIDAQVEMATAAVDLALEKAGSLPSQEAAADLIKQDIEEIGNRLKDAAEATGDAAMEKLDASIDQFNQTLENVDDASKEATNPEVKSTLDRIYGILNAAQEQLVQTVLNKE
jgi:hypothetical protein